MFLSTDPEPPFTIYLILVMFLIFDGYHLYTAGRTETRINSSYWQINWKNRKKNGWTDITILQDFLFSRLETKHNYRKKVFIEKGKILIKAGMC